MVLDDASPQAGSYTAGNGSDYTRSQGPPGQNPALARYFPLKIKPELVVQPDLFTLYFGFFGASNWKRVVAGALTERVENTWLLTDRGPTQDEMDAFTTHTSRSIYYRRIGVPLSSFLGTAYLYNQMRKMPNVPQKATPAQFFATLRAFAKADKQGFRSMMAKQAFKMLFITTTGAIASAFLSVWSDTKGVLTDPRLRQFVEDMKGQKPEDIRKRKLEAVNERVRRVRGGEQDIRRQVREELGGGSYDQGADQDPYGYDNAASVSTSGEGDYSASQYPQQNGSMIQPRSTPDASRRPQMYGSASASRGMGNGQPSSGSDFFFSGGDDDASPTAPEYRHTNMDGSPAGSAWERIRRQSGVPGPQQSSASSSRTQQWGQSQNGVDSSSYSSSESQDRYDYDRRREKDQAQADFDKLMEAERNAANDGPSRGRGWGS